MDTEVYRLLELCDNDFTPPLSARNPGGLKAYYKKLKSYRLGRAYNSKGKLIGLITWKDRKTSAYLKVVMVHPDYRGQGIGRMLYDLCERQSKAKRINVKTWAGNRVQMELLPKRGYREVKRDNDARTTVYWTLDVDK